MQGRGKYNKRRPAKVNTRVERKIIWEIPRLGEQFGDYCKESQIFVRTYWFVWKDCTSVFKQTQIFTLHKTMQRDSYNKRL